MNRRQSHFSAYGIDLALEWGASTARDVVPMRVSLIELPDYNAI